VVANSADTRRIAPVAFWTVSSSWTISSSGRWISSTYWNSRNAVPIVIVPLATSTAPLADGEDDPPTAAPCTAHHMPRNADSRRTPLSSAPADSSTKRHMACDRRRWNGGPRRR
jgi:hypothetical protein